MTDQTTLQQIFSMDPNKCSKQNILDLVEAYRARRKQFDLGNMKAGSSKPLTGKAVEVAKAITTTLDL